MVQHLGGTVLPLVRRIVRGLGLKPTGFELSVTNLGAASTLDVGLEVSGFSADAAVTLAALSAALKLPLPQDAIVTGHVASPEGELRPVRSIPRKLAAAAANEGVRRFVCPALDADRSVEELAPNEWQRIADATSGERGNVRIIAVTDIAELLSAVVDDEALVRAALSSGFFGHETDGCNGSPADRAIASLAARHEERFLGVVDAHLLAGRVPDVHALLRLRCRFQCQRRRYPSGLGRHLLELMSSLPPALRRIKGWFPLVPLAQCLRLCTLAARGDHEDVQRLLDAVHGRLPARDSPARTRGEAPSPPASAAAAVDAVIAEISAETLAEGIGLPIDSARAAYVLPDATIDSYDDFHELIVGFHLALLRRTSVPLDPADSHGAAAEAYALLERAFADHGGPEAAWAEARHGTRGGARFVLDAMTEQLKSEHRARHVGRVLKEAVDPLDWDERVAFMAALLERLAPHLPAGLRSAPPERFARHYEAIARAYVRSLDPVTQLLRRL
ncbi:MAG: hypothetical protein ISS72_09050 [Candidatus Brocadiae bacterium]|nr:hypothetical protein [Candidatus Brocadiia bacterium]